MRKPKAMMTAPPLVQQAPVRQHPKSVPVHTIRHRRIKASIWRNGTDRGLIYNVTVVRSYRDGDGSWHDSTSFSYDDLMNVAKLLADAHSFISTLRVKDAASVKSQARPIV